MESGLEVESAKEQDAGFVPALQRQQLQLLAVIGPKIAAVVSLLVVMLATLGFGEIDHLVLALWLGSQLVLSLVLGLFCRPLAQRLFAPAVRLWAIKLTAMALGAFLIPVAFWLLQNGLLTQHLIIPLVILGLSGGCTSLASGYAPLSLGIVLPAVGSFAAAYLFQDNLHGVMMAGLMAAMMWFLIYQARSAHAAFNTKFRLEYENACLATMLDSARDTYANESWRDPLTGMANRAAFSDVLAAAMDLVAETGLPVSLLMIDLDQFKALNDHFGRTIGDSVLLELSRRVQMFASDRDFVARTGGDRFSVVMRHDTRPASEIVDTANHILNQLTLPVEIDGRPFSVSASGGLVSAPQDATTVEDLLSYADLALYGSKDGGRHRLTQYTGELKFRADMRQELALDLSAAISRREILLYFQPQVEIRSGRVIGFEGLLRWNHPSLGWVPPPRVIQVALEQNLGQPLFASFLKQTCDFLDRLAGEGMSDIIVSVNISPSGLAVLPVPEMVEELICARAINPKRLCLEITEESVLEGEVVGQRLRALERIGTPLSIDDFGSGYSSFSEICAFQVSSLKIDQQFVRNCTTSITDRKILTAMLSLGRSLGVKMVAEGVETAEQLALISALGYNIVQGFYYAQALEPVAALEFAIRHNRAAKENEDTADSQRTDPGTGFLPLHLVQ